jgi:tRNA-binding EMAP/Myf-like protein
MKVAGIKPTISLDLLNQVEIRVGTIEAVADVPRADKLVRMRANFGVAHARSWRG